MPIGYDNYYQTEDYFGDPYPALIDYFSSVEMKGKLLDLGCGQGRDAIPLARLGFKVTGIDASKVGIEHLNRRAEAEQLPLQGFVGNMFEFDDFGNYDFILLDSLFHFGKKEKEEEIHFLKRIIGSAKPSARITICIQNTGNKVQVLHALISDTGLVSIIHRVDFVYVFKDKESGHGSGTDYVMITLSKN
jgi:2-polyprenyl-3-methyl-5-hydroxy-6-metoxy-1,4-benzoquinol methylase